MIQESQLTGERSADARDTRIGPLAIVALGASAGIACATAEAFSLGLCGLPIEWTAALSHGILLLLVGMLLGGCALIFRFLADRLLSGQSCATLRTIIGRAQICSIATAAGFSAIIFLWAVREFSRRELLPIAFFAAILLLLQWLEMRKLNSVSNPVFGVLALSFLTSATIAYGEFGPEIAPWTRRMLFGAAAYAPPILVVAAALTIKRDDRRQPVNWLTGGRVAAHIGIVLAVFAFVLLLWAGGVLPLNAMGARPVERAAANAPESIDESGKTRPNIMLVVIDTVRADHLDLFGYHRQTMPRLTAFARQDRTMFAAINAPSPSTLPTHASMFTGTYPARHGAHKPFVDDDDPPRYAYPLGLNLETLAEKLSSLKYRTGAISANFGPLHPEYGLSRGFQHYDARPGVRHWIEQLLWVHYGQQERSFARLLAKYLPDSLTRKMPFISPWGPPYRRAGEINEEVIKWLELDPSDTRPFFLFINYFDAHDPYLPPGEYENLFADDALEPADWVGFPYSLHGLLLDGKKTVSPSEKRQMESRYDGELAYLDRKLGELLGHMDSANLLKDMLVIIVSDHGEGFGEHGFLRHSTTLYETQTSVPLIIRIPEMPGLGSRSIPESFQHVDIFPTILDLLGEDAARQFKGVAWGEGRPYAVSNAYVHDQRAPRLRRELNSIVSGGHKFIMSSKGDEELYDLAREPGETRNLLDQDEPTANELRSVLQQWTAEHAGYRNARNKGSEDRAIDKLRSLGYIQ